MVRYALLGLVLMPTVLSAAPELKGDPAELANYLLDEKRVVAIVGSSEVKVQADRASVTLRVKTKDATFVQALKKNREVRTKLSQQLQQAGIPPDRIVAAKFSSLPNYGFFGDKPSSYEISNDVSVVVRGEDDMAVIAQAVDSMKEVSYLATLFEDSNKKNHQGNALDDALADIARKKSAYEKALGITLTPLRVDDDSYQPVQQVVAPFTYQRNRSLSEAALQSSVAIQSSPEFAGNATANDAGSGGFGELRYGSNIRVEFLLQAR